MHKGAGTDSKFNIGKYRERKTLLRTTCYGFYIKQLRKHSDTYGVGSSSKFKPCPYASPMINMNKCNFLCRITIYDVIMPAF